MAFNKNQILRAADLNGLLNGSGVNTQSISPSMLRNEAWVDFTSGVRWQAENAGSYTNNNVGNGVLRARYWKYGRTVNYVIRVHIGPSGETINAGNVCFNLPFNAGGITTRGNGICRILDNSSGIFYVASVDILDNHLFLYPHGIGAAMSNTNLFTLGDNDQFYLSMTYEATS